MVMAWIKDVALEGKRNRFMICFMDWVKRTCWSLTVGRSLWVFGIMTGWSRESLVLWLAEIGKKWEGASLGRTSEFCLVQMVWDSYEMLLCLYWRGMFSRLVWNSCEICLHRSQPCCCLSPCIPINFKKFRYVVSLFLIRRSHFS